MAKTKQFTGLSIRLTEGEYQAVQAEQQRLLAASGVEVSLNAVLTGLIRSGLEMRAEILKNGGWVSIPPPY
jgi:hypothetical protein